MSADWCVVRLADIASKITKGTTPSKKDGGFSEAGINYIKAESVGYDGRIDSSKFSFITEDVHNKLKRSQLEVNDILFSMAGVHLGKVGVVEQKHVPANTNQALALIRLKGDLVKPLYVLYFLQQREVVHFVNNATSQSAQPNINLQDIGNLEIRLPSFEVQKNIVNILSSLDNKIELNNQINQTLEQMAQAIFKSWFVDFEPVKAKSAALEAGGSEDDALLAAMQAIAGNALFASDAADADAATQLARLQTEHPERYATLRATAELFPSAMQESELGEIPEGWTTKEIKALSTKISKGSTPRKSDLQNAEDPELIEFLKVRDLSDEGEIARTGLDKIPKSVHSGVLKRSILEADDILFSIAGTIGRVAVIEEELSDSNCNQALAFIRLAEPLKYLELCRLNLVGSRVQNEVVSKVVQGVQANFSLASLGEILIVIPLDGVLYEFNNTVTKFSKKRKELMTEVRVLAELRDTLLPKLLSGELSLAATEEQLADTVEPAHV